MAKVYRNRRRSVCEILASADKREARALNSSDRDDPAWLRRRAKFMRMFALKRAKGRQLKSDERQKTKRERIAG